ncbi:hypothetical protein G9C85_10060 [Halorubellus sp. JP-L1]|nr:hypothetical protein [Halorubellus sp. JP-L1]
MVLILLAESNMDSSVRYETSGDGASAYPYVYGPQTLDAVIDSFPFVRNESGYRLSDELLRHYPLGRYQCYSRTYDVTAAAFAPD